jgi:cell division septation protein DedD
MGDDFDLFPKRENLDPFSFKTPEKKTEPQEKPEDLFKPEEQPPPGPEAPPVEPPATETEKADADIPVSDPFPPLEPSAGTESQPEAIPVPEPEGPISESKTFDEPTADIMPPPEETDTRKRKAPSPFIVVGGALIIIIGLLYIALTFLKRDRPPVPTVPLPEVSAPVEPQATVAVPVPEPEKPEEEAPVEPPAAGQPAPEAAEAKPPAKPEPEVTAETGKPEAPETVQEATKPPAEVAAVGTAAPAGGRYSVQVGAFILEASVRELEKKLTSLGYETFRKEGSTKVLMNMLTVGPFPSVEKAREAVADLREAGIESNLVRRSGGGAVVNAGSYLLDENANNIERKIRSIGYPVTLSKKEARLPMTFVRVGRFEEISDANGLRDELKEKGQDAIVVKLQ